VRALPGRDGLVFFDLVGGVFSEGDGCLTGGGVLDFADGATRRLAGPVVAAAGRYAIVGTGGPRDEQLELVDWRSGARLRRLADLVGIERDRQVSVAGDGTVAWAGRNAEVVPLGAKDPVAVPFPHVPGGSIADQVRLGGGLLAVRSVTRRSLEDVHTFQLTGLDGSDRREVDGQRVGGGWAFDGRRLAWATQPCAQFVIQVWDVAGAPPPDAPDRCAVPAIGSEPIRMRDRRLLPVRLACPASPAQGARAFWARICSGPGAIGGSPRRSSRSPACRPAPRAPSGSRSPRLGGLRGLHRLRASIGFEAFRGGATVAHANVTRR
jgi:hypothetical protein